MESGLVPSTGMPARSSVRASLSGVWPPSATTTPARPPSPVGAFLEPSAHGEDVFGEEGLEEEPVAGVVVGGDGLGVAVEHHRLEAGVGQRERRVHAAVVELDALTDAVRAAPEDHDRGAGERRDLVVVLVGAVVVRRPRRELRRARIHRLVRHLHTGGAPCARTRPARRTSQR